MPEGINRDNSYSSYKQFHNYLNCTKQRASFFDSPTPSFSWGDKSGEIGRGNGTTDPNPSNCH